MYYICVDVFYIYVLYIYVDMCVYLSIYHLFIIYVSIYLSGDPSRGRRAPVRRQHFILQMGKVRFRESELPRVSRINWQ